MVSGDRCDFFQERPAPCSAFSQRLELGRQRRAVRPSAPHPSERRIGFAIQGAAYALRIDLGIEGNAETIILDPSNRPHDLADIAQFDHEPMPALDADIRTLGHHSTIGEIAHTYAMAFSLLLNLHSGKQKQTVTRLATCFHPGH
jgi:hypothetical protein